MVRWLTLIAWTLVAVGTAGAQINHPYNEVGIYTVEQPDGCAAAQIDVPAMTQFEVYVVLTAPYNEDLGRPVSTVGGYDFRLVLPPEVYLLSVDYGPCQPPFTPTMPDFLIGCELPVTAGQATLMAPMLMAATADPLLIYLAPILDSPQYIPGEMTFTDLDDGFSHHVMRPISGSFDVPVFAINWDGDLSFCETVPARAESFGTVKALYR